MKYIRTYHLPNSESISNDDKIIRDLTSFIGKEVIYTEKLDGENTSFLRHRIHARSEDSNHHPSRNWVKGLHSQIAWKIPANYQIVGENVFAKHSIYYDQLTTFFYTFAVIDLKNSYFLSVDETLSFIKDFDLEYVPVLFKGNFDLNFKIPTKSAFGNEIEGYVVRKIEAFPVEDACKYIAKCVRKNHVQTDKHWTKTWKPNCLKNI